MNKRFYLLYHRDAFYKFDDIHEVYEFLYEKNINDGFVEYVEPCLNFLKVILNFQVVVLDNKLKTLKIISV